MAQAKKVTDNDLIEQFKAGSMDAFEEIMSRYQQKVYNLAMRFTRNEEDAEEVLQDVFSTLYRKLQGFEGKSAFSSWLYRVIVNASYMKLRKRKQDHTISMEDLSPTHQFESKTEYRDRSDVAAANGELRNRLQGAIDKLPLQYRAVFVLRDVDGLSNQEVSEILSLSVPAVKSRLHRSRLMLRKRLHRFFEDYTGQHVDPAALEQIQPS